MLLKRYLRIILDVVAECYEKEDSDSENNESKEKKKK